MPLCNAQLTFAVRNDASEECYHIDVAWHGKVTSRYCHTYAQIQDDWASMPEGVSELHDNNVPWFEYLAVRWTAKDIGYTGRLLYVAHPDRIKGDDTDAPGLWAGIDA